MFQTVVQFNSSTKFELLCQNDVLKNTKPQQSITTKNDYPCHRPEQQLKKICSQQLSSTVNIVIFFTCFDSQFRLSIEHDNACLFCRIRKQKEDIRNSAQFNDKCGLLMLLQNIIFSKMRNCLSNEAITTGSSILQQFTIGYNGRNSCAPSEKDAGKKSQKSIGANRSINNPKLAFSFKMQEALKSDGDHAETAIAYPNDDYYHELQQSLMGENENLKDHNAFLVVQIKSLFEREKKYKKAMLISKQKIDKLEELNQHLQNQLLMLTNGIVEEIQRMQKLIDLDRSILADELRDSAGSDLPKILEGLGEETEATLNHNLEELKSRVNNLCNTNISRVNECQDFVEEDGPFEPHHKADTTANHQSNPNSPTIFRDFSQGFMRKSQDDCYQPINQLSKQSLTRRLPPKQR